MISYNVMGSSENMVLDQITNIFFVILTTCLLSILLIFKGNITPVSLMKVKELNNTTVRIYLNTYYLHMGLHVSVKLKAT